MSDQLDKIKENLLKAKEELEKRAPKGVNPEKHESCVMDVKAQGHDVGSAHAICTASMKKDDPAPSIAGGGVSASTVNPSAAAAIMSSGGFRKDETDEKIKAKLKAEMDKRNFGEADATRHVIDRDRGAKMPKPVKAPKPLLQSEQEVYKTSEHGQWKIEKSNYGPKGMGLYNQNDNAKRKAKNTGDVVEDAGKNVNVKSYTTSGSSMAAAAEAAEAKKRKANPAPVRTLKDMTPEEIEAIGKPKK